MRIFLVSILLLVTAVPALAQWDIGVGGGVSINTWQTNIDNRPQQHVNTGNGLFFELPVGYRIPIIKKSGMGSWGIAVRAACTFIQKNYALDRTDTLQSLNQQYTNTYLQLPLSAAFFFQGSSCGIQLGGGYYVGYWTSALVKGGLPNMLNTNLPYPAAYSFDQSYGFDSQRDNRWEQGWTVDAKLTVKVNSSMALFGAAHYFQSLTDQQKEYMLQQIPRYNSTWAFSLGLQMQNVW